MMKKFVLKIECCKCGKNFDISFKNIMNEIGIYGEDGKCHFLVPYNQFINLISPKVEGRK